MIVCPFAPKYHCRPTCVFRVASGKVEECLIREALIVYLGYERSLDAKTLKYTVIKEEE